MIKKEIYSNYIEWTIEAKGEEMTLDELIELLKELSKDGYGQRFVSFGTNDGASYYPTPRAYITPNGQNVELGD